MINPKRLWPWCVHLLEWLGLNGSRLSVSWKIFAPMSGQVSHDDAYFTTTSPLDMRQRHNDNAKHTASYDSSPRRWRTPKTHLEPNNHFHPLSRHNTKSHNWVSGSHCGTQSSNVCVGQTPSNTNSRTLRPTTMTMTELPTVTSNTHLSHIWQ